MNAEENYTVGFNNGYLIAKYEPMLTEKITQNLQLNTEYIEGFLLGKEEYEIEKSLEQFNELQRLRNATKDREQDLEKGK
jgi:hypothetical protein